MRNMINALNAIHAQNQLAGGRLVVNNTAVKRLRVCNCCNGAVACSLVASLDLKNKKLTS